MKLRIQAVAFVEYAATVTVAYNIVFMDIGFIAALAVETPGC
jgi:hypothetical protein